LVGPLNSAMISALFGGGQSASGVSAELLSSWAAARAGVGADTTALTRDPKAPVAEVWTPGVSLSDQALAARALSGKAFFDPAAKLYTDLGASGDYRRLFALYTGVSTLKALAGRAVQSDLSGVERDQIGKQFSRGLAEMQAFFAKQSFDDIRVAQGDRVDAVQSTLALKRSSEDYVSGVMHRGGLYNTVAGLDPEAAFTITVTSAAGTVANVAIDLSQMGSIPRTLGAVISHINGKLAAAGAATRFEASDQTPKTTKLQFGAQVIETKYSGPKQYALKIDVRAGETIALAAAATAPAFYALGATPKGQRLIKLADVGESVGEPQWLARPAATIDPSGAHVTSGWYGAGAPYLSAPTNAVESRSPALADATGFNTFETALRAAGEATLRLDLGDGRQVAVTAGWRAEDLEAWRVRAGEGGDRAILDDLAERLTQLLHEQGVAAGVDVWENGGACGLSVFTGGLASASKLTIAGKSAALDLVETSAMSGGLNDAAFARRFEAAGVAAAGASFVGAQTFMFARGGETQTIVIDGGTGGIDAAALAAELNTELRQRNVAAAASLVDISGALTLRVDALHGLTGVSATLNDAEIDALLQAPGAWANGGLPIAAAGSVFADSVRTYSAASNPLLTHTGALDVSIVVETPLGTKTVAIQVSAQERLDNPDVAAGQWSAVFQDRLDGALNEAGVYLAASGGALSTWQVAEGTGQRLASVTINGAPMLLTGAAPGFGLGGAHASARSFTSAAAASSISDDVAALLLDDSVSVTFTTVWGERTVPATLAPSDPRSLQSAALRLNEALAAQGYDLGVAAVALSGGGAGLRLVTSAFGGVRGVASVGLGAEAITATLDPIDSISHADDPIGAARVYERAGRGAAIVESTPALASSSPPSVNASSWFPGRALDIAIGGGAKTATARATATSADGAIYVLADLDGASDNIGLRGERDVALLKYDSAGKLVFTQMLGAAEAASGFALAVSADGARVAVAGAVEGGLSGTTARGEADAFVAVFSADGDREWVARRGADGDDQVNALAFAADGTLVAAGQTSGALPSAVSVGQRDGYVRGYSQAGAELFVKQFGTVGADAAGALLVRDNGAGGIDIITAGVENNRGVLRRFGYSAGAGFVVGASRDIGNLHEGAIAAIAAEGSSLYVAGSVGGERLNVGATARAASAGKEGFVARLDADLTSTALDRTSYLGSAQSDRVTSLAVSGGSVYAAGVTGGVIAGVGASGAETSFIARLDADGDVAWAQTIKTSGAPFALTSLAVDAGGASTLDVLGLPRGALHTFDSNPLTARSGLRAGDEFRIGAEGRGLTTIRIGDEDTLASLATAITRAVSGAGRARLVREGDVERIEITPNAGKAIRIEPGRAGREALGALGFAQGVVAVNAKGFAGVKTYGLGLIAQDFDLSSEKRAKAATAELSAALSIIRQAYETLANPNAKEMTDAERALEARRNANSPASEYYSAQLANYRAALQRLGGG
jgi:hypothetical protein